MSRRSSPAPKPLKPNDLHPREVRRFDPNRVVIPEGRRPLNETVVAELVESIGRFGLLSPIAVRMFDEMAVPNQGLRFNVPVLVVGRHRLEACKRLGLDSVDGIVFDGDETEARLAEISENLHRAELSVQERADHIAEWVRLTGEKAVGASCATSLKDGRKAGPQHRPSGINAAVRELGIDRTEAQRSLKIASIPESARTAADAAGLVSQAARLEIAKAPDPLAKVEEIAVRKATAAEQPRKIRVRIETTETKICAPHYIPDPRVPSNPDRDKVITALNHAKSSLRPARDAAGRLGKGAHIDALLTNIDDNLESFMTKEDDDGARSILDRAQGPKDTRH